jgi:molybdopterin molybdotransferase
MAAFEIAPSCCAERSAFVSIETARLRAIGDVDAVKGEEIVTLRAARGRVTVSAIVASHAVPPFDQSAMDGYAVRTGDFIDGAATLPVVARQIAGADHGIAAPAAPAAARIFTGAVIPPGFDAVVMQEECVPLAGAVTIARKPEPGEHIRPAGDDVAEGAIVVRAATLIDSRHIAILAAAGVPHIRVRRRVRVGVVSTGNELRQAGEPLRIGEIHDSNRAMLLALLDMPAVELVDLGCVRDSRPAIAHAFEAAARDLDVVISTGGVSVGEEDHVAAAVNAAGGTLSTLRAAIKPGKPASVGRLGAATLIGLPGNPVSALVTFLWFARAIVLRRMGLNPATPSPISAVAGFDEVRRPGRDEFVPVVISGYDADGRPIVEKRRRSGSARLSSLMEADGFARIPGELSALRRGHALGFYAFGSDFAL